MSETDDIADLGLNPRQIQFCREYIVDMNATQAYIRAGYAEDGARQNASRLMAKDDIQDLISRFARDRAMRTITEGDQVISQLARLASGDIRRMFTGDGHIRRIEDVDDDTAAALQSVKVTRRPSGEYDDNDHPIYEDVIEFKMADKKGPLELLGKHMKLWTEAEISERSAPSVMLVPMMSPEDWAAASAKSQDDLKKSARD